MAKLAKRQHLDPAKLVHLSTSTNPRRVHIVADYDNPTHERCEIRSFKGNSLKDIRIPASAADYVHGHVELLKRMMERAGDDGRFPIRLGDPVPRPPGWKSRGGGEDALDKLDACEQLGHGAAEEGDGDGDGSEHALSEPDELELEQPDGAAAAQTRAPCQIQPDPSVE
ncbi:16676c2c-d44c-4490-a92b-a10fe1894af4 [Thermothielavioides terrestris]|nr:16676c2c-d44c-4490-a92b-a10fe1894af4 [Thermothielavioides terrestris]